MPIKRLVKPIAILALLLLACLGTALWAMVSFDDVVAGAPPVAATPLSSRQAAILLKVEDPTFFEHHGISIARGQGFATISSALARDLYLNGVRLDGMKGIFQVFYRAVHGCCKQIDLGRDVMAVVLDAKLSKEKQLAMYVAGVYMGTNEGRQIKGLAAAAESYLGKPLDVLTDAEFIGLVAMIKAPNRYHPVKQSAEHALRAARIEAYVAGRCQSAGWFDTSFDGCDPPPLNKAETTR
jgi:membrane carboxypeptidase/penicillin-binding protein